MGLGLLLVPALAGYLFLKWFHGTCYSLPRETGYHVVFKSAIAGVLLFFIARLFVVLIHRSATTPDPQQVLEGRPARAREPLLFCS